MLDLIGRPFRCCDGVTRRSFLAGAAGVSATLALGVQQAPAQKKSANLRLWILKTYVEPTNKAMAKLKPEMDAKTFSDAAEAQKELIETDETKKSGLGTMSEARWTTLAKQLADLKVISKAPAAKDCFVNP